MTVVRDRLVSALKSALHTFGSDLDPDDIEEQAYFLAGEIDDAGIRLPEPVIGNPGLDSVAAGRIMTLEELEALPLTGVLGLHLEQLCGLDNVATMYCIEYVLDSYAKPPDAQIEEALLTTQSTQRACELCEREAVSTQHHLIPRAEHDLMVKRGHFTMDECTWRNGLIAPRHVLKFHGHALHQQVALVQLSFAGLVIQLCTRRRVLEN